MEYVVEVYVKGTCEITVEADSKEEAMELAQEEIAFLDTGDIEDIYDSDIIDAYENEN